MTDKMNERQCEPLDELFLRNPFYKHNGLDKNLYNPCGKLRSNIECGCSGCWMYFLIHYLEINTN